MIIEDNFPLKFDSVNDPIRTEEFIYYQLKQRENELNFQYVALPLAFSINNLGINQTQEIINRINSKYVEKKVFVCQHIFVDKLSFGENYVFTPHTTNRDTYHFIPHYNPSYDRRQKFQKSSDRKYNISFIGDLNTNIIRKSLRDIKSDKYYFTETDKWFFSYDSETQSFLRAKYLKILETTVFPLCPQGTGPSTLRLFETMSSGGIPFIFNDIKLPSDLEKNIFRTSPSDCLSLSQKLQTENLNHLQEDLLETYWSEYSNDKLYKSIFKKFKK